MRSFTLRMDGLGSVVVTGRVYHGPTMTGLDAPRRGWKLPPAPRIAVVGARGLVGETLLQVLQRREFPHAGIKEVRVRDFTPEVVADADLIFLAAPNALSKQWAKELISEKRVVIDLSESWRLDPSVPLLLSDLNLELVEQHQGLIASPNCTNGGLVRVIEVLRRKFSMERMVVTTLQAASGGGRQLLQSLDQPKAPLHGNVIPECDSIAEDGGTLEEHRVVEETLRLLGSPALQISATCVRVPVEVGHGVSVWIEGEQAFDLQQVQQELQAQPNMNVAVDAESAPTPQSVRGQEGVFIGRLRHGAKPTQLQLWIVTDNLLTGAASNAVDIATALLPQ